MIKKITCIDCPKGCRLEVEVESGKVQRITGQQCPKGETYATQEIEAPRRVLTSVVLTEGLELKMVPVRTSGPIPNEKLLEGMQAVKKMKISKPVKSGEIIAKNLLGLGVEVLLFLESWA